MFAIAWEYLTGRAVASDATNRTRAEWPPHPDRVFQALVAAWGESDRNKDARMSLEWLESQPPPGMAVPDALERPALPVFVPANDIEAGTKARKYGDPLIALLPAHRSRKDRRFPSLTVGDAPAALIWKDSEPSAEQRSALAGLCPRVTHIGHSSSLVRMWISDEPPQANYVPSDAAREVHLRVPSPGRLAVLIEAYADGGPNWRRPPLARRQGYARTGAEAAPAPQSLFGDDWIVLRRVAGSHFGLAQAPAVAEALRKTLIKASGDDPIAKTLISGHAPDGSVLEKPHAAFVPLADVGHEHADGHLMGAAMVLPRELPYQEKDVCFRALAEAGDPESGAIRLVFGAAGELTLLNEDREQPPLALRPGNWCRESRRWASVTPIALDRLPPRARRDHDDWAAAQLGLACERIGLPRPESVCVLPVSRFTRAPTCKEFPPLLRRTDGGPRWHVHAELVFAAAVRGPVLLGAGRYRGYGICRPIAEMDPS